MTPEQMYVLLDKGWEQTKQALPALFSTQDFQVATEEQNAVAWAAIVAKYGKGGRGSGNFFSPNNILQNYLKKRAKGDDLTERGFMPSAKGWGSHVVKYWELTGDWSLPTPQDEDLAFIEGRAVFRQHLARERKGGWRRKVLEARKKRGLQCEGCDTKRPDLSLELQEALFEVHHTQPLSAGERKTKMSDLALLCACCHRVVHKVMRIEGRNVEICELRKILAPPNH